MTLTEEQKKQILGGVTLTGDPELMQAQADFVKAGQAGTPAAQSLAGGTITSQNFINQASLPYVNPAITPVYPVAGLDITTNQTTPLPKEQEQSDIIKQTQALMDQISGKSTYQAQQEQAGGLPELQKTQTDLAAQIKSLQNESAAAQLAYQYTIPNQVTSEFIGRASVGEIGRQTDAQRRSNQILQGAIASKALGLSSLLEASRGNLAFAQSQADKAVAQKYDPIEARINANLKNLELLSKDPTLTLAQQNRLEAQTNRKQNELAQVAQQRKTEEEIKKEVLKYANITTAPILDEMSKAKDIFGVAQVAAKYGLKTLEQQKTEAEIAKLRAGGGVAVPVGDTYKTELAGTGREAVAGMLSIAEANPGIFGKTAALPLPDFVRSDAFRNYRAQLDFLRGNIIPAALSAMREASKTGGALGQVSDREGAWLASSLGALDMTQSPEQVKAQLRAIDAHLATWQNAVEKYGGGTKNPVITAPDGTQVEIID